jgi:hypothetical protein
MFIPDEVLHLLPIRLSPDCAQNRG